MKVKIVILLITTAILFLVVDNIFIKKSIQQISIDENKSSMIVSHKDEPADSQPSIQLKKINKESSLINLIGELNTIDKCVESLDCYSQKGPKDYAFQHGKRIVSQLKEINQLLDSQKIKSNQINSIAKKYISYEGDEIKLESLKLLSSQGIDSHIIKPIFEEVFSSPNPQAIKLATRMLSQLDTASEKQEINEKIYNLITQGGIYPALEVVKNLEVLLNDDSRQYFEQALYDLKKSSISEKLYNALKEKLKQ